MSATGDAFLAQAPAYCDVGTARIAVRRFGAGPPLLLLHGWPLWGFTYRHLVARLAAHRTCYVVDSPGAGHTEWQPENDFSFTGQAANFARLIDGLGLSTFDLLAHDTGATIARQLTLLAGARVRRLVLIGTEIPGHRPPWISLFQKTAALPGARRVFRTLLRSRAFRRSSLGLGELFADKALLEGEFDEHIVQPLLVTPARLDGQVRYLRGIDWQVVDGMAEGHRRITCPVLLVWGDADTIFPRRRAEVMVGQFPDCRGLVAIPGAKLLVHEEQPDAVAAQVLAFLTQ